MIVASPASDIVTTAFFTGVFGNYLKPGIMARGLDPNKLSTDQISINPANGDLKTAKAWRDVRGCGQGIGVLTNIERVADLIDRCRVKYADSLKRLGHLKWSLPSSTVIRA